MNVDFVSGFCHSVWYLNLQWYTKGSYYYMDLALIYDMKMMSRNVHVWWTSCVITIDSQLYLVILQAVSWMVTAPRIEYLLYLVYLWQFWYTHFRYHFTICRMIIKYSYLTRDIVWLPIDILSMQNLADMLIWLGFGECYVVLTNLCAIARVMWNLVEA